VVTEVVALAAGGALILCRMSGWSVIVMLGKGNLLVVVRGGEARGVAA
jgi:hypothetical protein